MPLQCGTIEPTLHTGPTYNFRLDFLETNHEVHSSIQILGRNHTHIIIYPSSVSYNMTGILTHSFSLDTYRGDSLGSFATKLYKRPVLG